MKTYSYFFKNLLVFLFFIFTTNSFSQTVETFNTAGTGTWVCPPGVTSIKIEAWGGGGGGGYARAVNNGAAGGGGGGEYTYSNTIAVVPGTTYYYRVGAGGTGGAASGTAATAGQSSCFSTGATCTGTILTSANGGNLGTSVSTNISGTGGTGGTGGVFTGGGSFRGGNGANGLNGNGATFGGGGGGGGASTLGNGGDTTNRTGGSGTGVGGGNGGSGASNAAGTNGANIGGGGAGGHRNNNNRGGGDGGTGQIKITYTPASPCLSAINLPCGTTNLAGTTVGTSDVAHGTGCSMSNYGRWYTFVGDGQITTISTNPSFDIKLSVATGSCGSLTNIACTDSSPESASFTTVNGVTYYVYVAYWLSGSSTTGTYTISRTCSAPIVNDNCAGAISVPVNPTRTCTSTVSGTILGATDSGVTGSSCGGTDDDDVWYSFVATSTTHHIELLSVAGSTTDLYHAVYSGTCGSLGTAILCSDPNTSMVTGLTPGNTYYLQIYSWGSSSGQNTTFNICISTDPPCTAPGAQANGFTAGTITSNSFPATFSGTADSYLVIRSTSATPPTHPVNGVIYTAANIGTLGTGLTIVQDGTSTSIAGTGLTGNTRYYYYIYAYNNTGCSGGPLYNASGPLTGNAVTCPSTPSPVTTSSTLTSIDFSWPSSLGGGINAVTYQLQITTDAGYTANIAGSPFTINHPTTTLNVTGLTSNTTYYYRIRANNGCWSAYTTGTATTGYCVPTNTYSTSYYISGVTTTGGIANISNTPTGFSAYTNYSAQFVSQLPGSNFSITATHPSSSYGYNVWVDWNNDLDFNDAGENVLSTTYLTSPAALGNITIPSGQAPGNYRMRIRNAYLDNPAPSCGSHDYGEAEDYTVRVIAPPACAGTPNAGTTTTTPNTGWPGSNYTVSATGYSIASNLTFQWQFSTDAGGTWTNAGAATSTYSNYSATAPASGIVHWRLVVTCTNSSQTATSTTGIFTTMTVSDVETGCPNVVSGGLGLNGADPLAINCTASSTCVDLEATYLDLGETTSYTVEPIAYNPPFAFNGLANPVSVNTDDVWSPIVPLPFDFCFFGNTYNQCVIGSNGILSFNTSLASSSSGYSFSNNIPISGDGRLVENSIFGVFHDIDPGVGGEVGWELITLPTGCRALVASWSDVPMFDENSILYSGMMVLYENSNIIEVYIKEKNIDNFGAGTWNDGNAIVGIQNATGTIASVAPGRNGLDPNWSATNEAWRFVPSGNSIASIAWYEGSGTTGPVVGNTPNINVCPTSTTTYTAEITYTLCDGRTIKEIDETTVTINGAKVWDGSVSTNWNVANNWTPAGVPTAMDCVVIPDTANDPIVSGTNFNALGLNLTIDNNATLTITPDNAITITDWVNINTTGDLVLQNSASLIQINDDANQGTMHMTRTANIRKLDYVYWSSPVTSFGLSNVSPGTTGNKYKWIPTIPSNTNGFGNWVGANENMVLGKGYIVRGPDAYTTTVTPFNAVFAGTPNNGTITTPIARGTWNGGTYPTGVSSTLGTNNDDNWNLLGNPYPSAIDAIDFLTLNTNIDGFINVWTHGTLPSSAIADPFYNNYQYNYSPGDYITYNNSGISSGPGTFGGYIGAGQGFFVLMNHTSASPLENVTFNNSMRSSAYDNTQFFRTSNDNGRIWLDLIASNGSNVRNLVAYIDGATNNRDRMFDAITDEKLSLNLYSLIGDELMKIQGRTLPFDQEDRVPMGIKVPQNGNYTIGIGAVDGFFTNDQNIYLEDKENNTIHDLRLNPYSFTANAGNYPNRFVLRYTNETLGGDDLVADDANLWVYSSDVLSVKSTKNTIQSVRVFDVLGRHLAYYPNVDSYEVPLTTIQKNNAGLIIQVTLSNGSVISKKAIY